MPPHTAGNCQASTKGYFSKSEKKKKFPNQKSIRMRQQKVGEEFITGGAGADAEGREELISIWETLWGIHICLFGGSWTRAM